MTVVRDIAMPERFTYFHVEIADHALILAEGVPAETFLDTVTRRRFDKFADYVALYGNGGPVFAEIAVPRVKSARQLQRALRGRLAVTAAARWRRPPGDGMKGAGCGGQRRRPIGRGRGWRNDDLQRPHDT